jgi:TPP-dependent pyruvate/acetoin dehydrogenase alpha subunit
MKTAELIKLYRYRHQLFEEWEKTDSMIAFETFLLEKLYASQFKASEPIEKEQEIAVKLIAIRDALVKEDYSEAYHQLYLIADPEMESTEPWKKLEDIARKQTDNGDR